MNEIGLSIRVQKPFGNLCRPRCVLVALGEKNGRILTGEKSHFLPPGITRLIGGGVMENEPFDDAAVREVLEETDVQLLKEQLRPLFLLRTHGRDKDDNSYNNETYVYYANIEGRKYQALDDINAIVSLSLEELYDLGDKYYLFSESDWYKDERREFCWADYGKMYGFIHKKTAEILVSF